MLTNEFKDRYRELMRVSRMWRDLMARISSGLCHETKAEPQPGDLAIFCPACPQPGINLPEEWENDPKRYSELIYVLVFQFSWISDGYILGVLSLMATSLLST